MALAQPWHLLAAGLVIIIAIGLGIALGWKNRGTNAADPEAPIARAERLRALGSFRSAVRRRIAALTAIIAVGVATIAVAGVAAARPMSSATIQPVTSSRDIMLCLDVSGSMSDVDVEVISIFEDLLDGFKGERIGLTIFNSSPVQVFPLTDDYEFAREHLQSIRESFDFQDNFPEHWVGTLNGPGASLIGDGLAACSMSFDRPDDERSRSIILATDNEVNGSSIVTLEEAAQYSQSVGVRVFAINPVLSDTPESKELIDAVLSTGGEAYGLRDTTTVGDIIDDVQKQDAAELRGEAQVIWVDTPNLVLVVLLVLGLGFLVLLWRVRI